MAARTHRLTPQLVAQIVAGIRAGGYAELAAQTWGVPRDQLRRWLAQGERSHAREPFRTLAAEVRAAQAQARLKAEMLAFGNARLWLLQGQGRETPDAPGWTRPVERSEAPLTANNPWQTEVFLRLVDMTMAALEPHPQAQRDLASKLDRWLKGEAPPPGTPPGTRPGTAPRRRPRTLDLRKLMEED